jgi:hypothetical protein
MKPYDMVSSLRGANTLLQGQQRTKTHTEKRDTEERSQKVDKSSRSKDGPTHIREDEITGDPRTRAEEPGPLRDTSEGLRTL